MYIGKHSGMPAECKEEGTRGIHLPQNYAGNAFACKEEIEICDCPPKPSECEAKERHLPLCIQAPKERGGLFAMADRLFSSDTLLILLAILLAGSEDGGELAVILLLLLLF